MSGLFISDDSKNGFWSLWPAQDHIPPGRIREGGNYLIELRNTEDSFKADLLIDGLLLDALRPPDAHTARWRWSPGFHAGTVEAELRLAPGKRYTFELITDPDIKKLTRDEFDLMVREILEDTFSLFSLSSFRTGVGRGTGSTPPPIARLEFLRSRMTEIISTVEEIARNPRRSLQSREISLPYHQAIRATGPEILRSFRSGRVLRETGHPSRLPENLQGWLPKKIRKTERTATFDIPEHRQIKSCLTTWAEWLKNTADLLDKPTAVSENLVLEKENEQLRRIWSTRAKGLSRRLTSLLSLPLFQEVGSQPGRILITSIYRNVAAYRRFYRLYQDMTLGIANIFGDFLNLPLARTWELYELWCFLRLLRASVRQYGVNSKGADVLFSKNTTGGKLFLSSNAIAVPLDSGIILAFQRSYREFWKEKDGRGSYSREMRPDVVFSFSGATTTSGQIIVLDAKYRIESGLNDALASIHMYRDALVRDEEEVKGIVTAAYLLSPQEGMFGTDWKTTGMPGRLFHPDYRTEFHFGAITLRPGMKDKEIDEALNTIIADALS